jgi:hypothetical protein
MLTSNISTLSQKNRMTHGEQGIAHSEIWGFRDLGIRNFSILKIFIPCLPARRRGSGQRGWELNENGLS